MTDFLRQHLISTPAKPGQCPRCQKGIWVATVSGFIVKADPRPLEIREEILLRLAKPKVKIYQTFGTIAFELQKRTSWHITKADPKVKVLAEHDCNGDDPGIIIDFFAKPEITKGEF